MNESKPTGNQGEEFEHYRVLLFSIAYRMTGSASDAEDLVQETYAQTCTARARWRMGQELGTLERSHSRLFFRISLGSSRCSLELP